MRAAAPTLTAVLLVAVAGCGTGEPIDVRGSVMVWNAFDPSSAVGLGQAPCSGIDRDGVIEQGTPVRVVDSAGEPAGVGSLGPGEVLAEVQACYFPFEVRDVTAGSATYGFEVGGREPIEFDEDEVRSGPVQLRLDQQR